MFIFQLTLNLLRHTSYVICKIPVAHIYPCQKNDQNQQVSSTFNFLMTLIYNNNEQYEKVNFRAFILANNTLVLLGFYIFRHDLRMKNQPYFFLRNLKRLKNQSCLAHSSYITSQKLKCYFKKLAIHQTKILLINFSARTCFNI